MKPSPQISVIIPVYNTEKYLRRCVDSILAQTFTDFELLLIDDGSTDSSPAICDEYARFDSRIRVFHKENGGASSARNIGLENAQGEWVTFSDSDDIVKPDWLRHYLTDNMDRFDIVSQGMESDKPISHKQRTRYGFEFEGKTSDFINLSYEDETYGSLCNKIFRNELIRIHQIKMDEKVKLGEDGLFITEYLTHSKECKSIKEAGYFYYVPDWDNKYGNRPNVQYSLERWHELLRLIYEEKPKGKIYFDMAGELLYSYYNDYKTRHDKHDIFKIRKLLQEDRRISNMKGITKIIILLDDSTLISRTWIRFLNGLRLIQKTIRLTK